MKKIISGLVVVALVMVGSWAMAQPGGGGMMAGEGHRYGAMGGYLWWWGVYGLLKVAVVVIGLWFLFRITKAVEKIAASKS